MKSGLHRYQSIAIYSLFRIGIMILILLLSLPSQAIPPHYQAKFEQQVSLHYQRLSPHKKVINNQFTRHQKTVQHIIQQLDKNKLPRSMILIPMIESTFDQHAVSHAKAAGLWQLMPATAKRFGLTVSNQQDERFNIARSTEAAMQYLIFLYNKFDRDLKLTLAAYNSGEGRVQRALKRVVDKHFSALRLPNETVDYVHKFYALAKLVNLKTLANPSTGSHFPPSTSTVSAHHEVRFLKQLFETKTVINMEPIQPLVHLN
ncbi:lytic transglycosylase domain-containing protein [Photobacterium lucens]|uniref:lytic transglycosylase domain-containing protein n=1 Tax=Photobacterium lucens TaxID=2562949 RepID=UPI00136E0B9F|nr:lytic transglycosylase domain-containing protein [Photobacterium lucens]MBP2701350.1 lytic transglycosylase domain-containing protein [Vibrio parahaemolyticus]MZG56596.1 lytic transglycosylase [Photobacterium lucens]MZG80740.1 lytic transglycosylase [Photobacterium lucens]